MMTQLTVILTQWRDGESLSETVRGKTVNHSIHVSVDFYFCTWALGHPD